MAAASANAQAARAEHPERASDGGRRVTQSGPLRAAPEAAVGIGGGGGDGFVVAARCSERRVAVGPRPSLLTFPLPHRTAVSREPGRWRPGADRLLLPSGRAVRGASQALRAEVSRPGAHLLPWRRGRSPAALRPGSLEAGGNCYPWGLGSGWGVSCRSLRSGSVHLPGCTHSFARPWLGGPVLCDGNALKSLMGSQYFLDCRVGWALFALASPTGEIRCPGVRVDDGSGVC